MLLFTNSFAYLLFQFLNVFMSLFIPKYHLLFLWARHYLSPGNLDVKKISISKHVKTF